MELTEKETTELNEFVCVCDDFTAGKFILADGKTTKIIDTINNSELLTQLVGDCLNGFAFDKEFEKAKQTAKQKNLNFKLPDEPAKIVGFTFCLLKSFLSGKVSFPSFIKEYFIPVENKTAFQIFCKDIINQFKIQVASILEMEIWEGNGGVKFSPSIDIPEDLNINVYDFYAKAEIVLTQISELIRIDKKIKNSERNDKSFFLSGMIESCKWKNDKIFTSFIIAFNIMFANVKSIKFLRAELQDLIQNYFESLN